MESTNLIRTDAEVMSLLKSAHRVFNAPHAELPRSSLELLGMQFVLTSFESIWEGEEEEARAFGYTVKPRVDDAPLCAISRLNDSNLQHRFSFFHIEYPQ